MSVQPGAVLFAVDMAAIAAFYERVVGMRRQRTADDHVVLEAGSFALTVHQIPERYARGIVIAVPPVVRESGAIKLSFRVDSIARARGVAAASGGVVYGPDREWHDESATVCDGHDPEGNVFQLVQHVGQ